MNLKDLEFDTVSIMGGYDRKEMEDGFLSLAPPLAQSVANPFRSAKEAATAAEKMDFYEDYGDINEYFYARGNNPTNHVLEKRLASLEAGEVGAVTNSGMGAISLVSFHLVKSGSEIVVSSRTYMRSFELFSKTLPKYGINTKIISNPDDLSEWEESISNDTKFVFLETPSNPVLFIGDIQKIADIAHNKNSQLIVDNTLATPALQKPIELGADLVINSLSKYLSGNGTILGGAIVGSEKRILSIKRKEYLYIGNSLSPLHSWMTLLGLETLQLRMDKHSDNAMEIAQFLENHSKVNYVNYPGLKSHPQHNLAKAQMGKYGALLSFDVGSKTDAFKCLDSFDIIPYATHEGSSRTVSCHPATAIFRRLSPKQLRNLRISEGLIRLSVGLESPKDIISDLEKGLAQI